MLKNLSPNAGDMDSILGWEDPLEKEMATHSSIPFFFFFSILDWEISWIEELQSSGGLQSMESQKSQM